MGYVGTVVQELDSSCTKLKEVRNVIDSLIADYDEVPALKKLFPKNVMYGINENIVAAQVALSLVVGDAKEARKKNG